MSEDKKQGEIYLAKPRQKARKAIPSPVLLIAFIIILTALFFFIARPYVTGYAASKGTFIDAVSFKADNSQEFSWTPENPGTITSVRISGALTGKGGAPCADN